MFPQPKKKSKKPLIIAVSVLALAVVVILLTYFLYFGKTNILLKRSEKITQFTEKAISKIEKSKSKSDIKEAIKDYREKISKLADEIDESKEKDASIELQNSISDALNKPYQEIVMNYTQYDNSTGVEKAVYNWLVAVGKFSQNVNPFVMEATMNSALFSNDEASVIKQQLLPFLRELRDLAKEVNRSIKELLKKIK